MTSGNMIEVAILITLFLSDLKLVQLLVRLVFIKICYVSIAYVGSV